MRRTDMNREVKEELWKLFDAGHEMQNLTVGGYRIDEAAIAKQHALWAEFRTRNPKKKPSHDIQKHRAVAC